MLKYLIDEAGGYAGTAIYPEPGQRWVATGWDGPVYDPAYQGGQHNAETGEVSGGEWVSTGVPPPPPVPQEVTMRQAKLALLHAGHLATVTQAIAAMPGVEGEAARIEWEYSSVMQRNKPFVEGIGSAVGLTSEQIDQLFIAAAGIE